MKIIHCITSLDTGGAERTLVRLVNHSNEKHLILTILNSHSLKIELDDKTKILSLMPISLRKLRMVHNFIKSFNPDIIQGWMYHGDLVASILKFIYKKPCIWNIRHGSMSKKYSSKKTYFLRFVLAILSHYVPKKIISCSYLGEKIHKKIGYNKNKFAIVHNGINLKFNPHKKIEYEDIDNKLRIGSIGRDSPQKNRKYFIEIINKIQKYRKIDTYIVGRGVSNSKEIMNNLLRNKVKANLFENQTSIEKIFSDIDILIITSLYGEGCPNVIIEAMLLGLIVFSTDVGDAKYILGKKDLIIPNNDSSLAADKIMNTLSKNNLKQLVEQNKMRALNLFNEEKMNKKYQDIWEFTLSQSNP